MTERWFVGVDLAWSARNPSGLAVLRGDEDGFELTWAGSIVGVDEMASRIRALPGDWMVAIDAPLVVRNRTGRRQSDHELSALYHRFEAGAYPTNLTLLRDQVRGADLTAALGEDGLRVLGSLPAARVEGRWAFEAYPHAGMVELFGLERTIKYKKGNVAAKRAGLRTLAETLRARLPALDPPLRLEPTLASLLTTAPESLRGRALKAQEDTLDAVFCAYLAGFVWRWGWERHRLLGSAPDGAVLVPRVRTDVDPV